MKFSAISRTGAALALGVLAAACGGGDKANTDTTAATAGGDTTTLATTPAPAAGGATMTDPNIVAMVSASNAAEIAAGETAQRKATNAQVKSFAADMVREHRAMQKMADSLTQANTQLVAQARPAADSAQNAMRASSDSLTNAPRGAAFDRMYMAQQVASHQKTLQDLNNFQTMAQDQSLRTLVQGAIPKVQQHLDRARQIQTSLGGAGGAAGDTTKRP